MLKNIFLILILILSFNSCSKKEVEYELKDKVDPYHQFLRLYKDFLRNLKVGMFRAWCLISWNMEVEVECNYFWPKWQVQNWSKLDSKAHRFLSSSNLYVQQLFVKPGARRHGPQADAINFRLPCVNQILRKPLPEPIWGSPVVGFELKFHMFGFENLWWWQRFLPLMPQQR